MLRAPRAVGYWLGVGQRRMAEDGAAVGLLRTDIPHFFRRHGWAVCGRHSHSRAGAREVLAELSHLSGATSRAPLDALHAAPPVISVAEVKGGGRQ